MSQIVLPEITATVANYLSNQLSWGIPVLVMVGAVSFMLRKIFGRAKLG